MGLCQVTVLYYVVRLGSSRKLTATFLICDLVVCNFDRLLGYLNVACEC